MEHCVDCGKEKNNNKRLRCRSCGAKKRHLDFPPKRGNAHFAWRGGRRLGRDGYILINVPLDSYFLPMAYRPDKTANSYYVSEHRLVMAQHLGRCLTGDEMVHHINGIRDDNRIENLELLSSKHEHSPHRALEQRISTLESRITQLEAENVLLMSQLGVEIWK